MYYLWILHYSLVKGVFRTRWKGLTNSIDGLAFGCLFMLSLSIFLLFVNKELLWDVIRKRMPLGPMAKGILLILAPLMIFMLSGRLTKQKIKTARKVIRIKSKINRLFSVLYISFFIVFLIWAVIKVALSRTPM